MFGRLIVNAYLNTNKFSEHTRWLLAAAYKLGLDMDVKTNAECLVQLSDHIDPFAREEIRPDFILFWDKDIRLAEHLEMLGYRVFNSAKAIANCDDKSQTHLILQHAGIPMPVTMFAPMTYPNIGYPNYDYLNQIEQVIGFPMVVKEFFGSFGAQVYLVHDHEELLQKVKEIGTSQILFQQFIKSSVGRDLRLQVVKDEVIACMNRYSVDGDFRANISNGGHMKKYEPDQEAVELAIRCCKLLELDFAGVDLLFGENGSYLVCEINSNAHFKNIYDCTGVDTAEKMLNYIIKRV